MNKDCQKNLQIYGEWSEVKDIVIRDIRIKLDENYPEQLNNVVKPYLNFMEK